MKIRYQEIEVRMHSGNAIVRITVPEWEVPVVQAIHPEVSVIRDVVREREAPSVSSEMTRLQAAYGAERQEGGFTGVTFAESVYGQHAVGTNALKRAMQGAVLPASTPVTLPDASPTLRQDLLQSLTDTPSEVSDLIGEGESDEEIAA